MAETQITRCPHCQTTFRIRLEQLAAAKGAVRCGSCLQVFKAANHLVSGEPKAPLKPSAATAKVATPKPITPAPIKDDIVFDDTDDDEIPEQFNDDPLEDFGIRQPDRDSNETFNSSLQLDDSIFSMQEKAKPSRYSLLDNNKKDIEFDFNNEFETDNFGSNTDNADESWASNLIEDEQRTNLKSNANDESWADALMDVDDDLVENIDMSFTKENVAKQEDDFVPSLEDEPESDQYHLGSNDDFEQGTIEIELNMTHSINDLLDEPLKLDNKGKRKTPVAAAPTFLWFWLSGAVVMLFALVAQVGYFKFDAWSRHPQYRPAYAFTCELLNCKLPAIQDVSLMKTQHFMVRPHPKVKQALYIDTLLINSADYQQPFPDLNLIFTGLNDQTIASRHFKPKEYLAGELAGSNSMPLNVPIHIAIEISNPGAEAVGYRIELVTNH
jgi:predicted Zn finger-like uncharacterized protein